MRRLVPLAAALALAACSKSPCQELGERLCRCQPNISQDTCKTQVQNQLKDLNPPQSLEDYCQQRLDGTGPSDPGCNAPAGADFCEWLLTKDGKDFCGLTPASPAP